MKPWFRKAAALFTITAAFAACAMVFAFYSIKPAHIGTFDEVKSSYNRTDALLMDRHGEIIHELRVDFNGRRLRWVPLKDISPALIDAVVNSEDKRFFEHSGVDWLAAINAGTRAVFKSNKRGASTITMQLAALINPELRPDRNSLRRGIRQKLKQMRTAMLMGRQWSKGEAIEAYLNLVSFRGELQGVSSASQAMFKKEPSGINQNEAVLMAAMIPSPNAAPEIIIKRATRLASAMSADADGIDETAMQALGASYFIPRPRAMAYHVATRLLSENRRQAVSSIDAKLQEYASNVLEMYLRGLGDRNVTDGAVIVIHNKTGEALAYVANRAGESEAPYVDAIKAKRQAGSTLKPFLYAVAIEKRIITAASVLEDSPLDIPTGRGMYRPENYDNRYRGPVTVRTALASSLNIPAVRTAVHVGPEEFAQTLKRLGFSGIKSGEHYGPSLALGSADVSLIELANAYRALANGGIRSELRFEPLKGKQRFKRALTKEAAFIISDILSDREARSETFGLNNAIATAYWSAVKTGTSKDMRDNWCVGYTRDYTVGVWVGNFNNAPMWDVSGVSGAAPVWLRVMDYLNKDIQSRPPTAPSGVTAKIMDNKTGRKELFIEGTEPLIISETRTSDVRPPKILYPIDGMIIAVDPDIPQDMQRVLFEAGGARDGYKWALNGNVIAEGPSNLWMPAAGKYELTLVDREENIMDSIRFEVR